MAYRYVILDVFTDKPLTGNALAVLPEAEGLDAHARSVTLRLNRPRQ